MKKLRLLIDAVYRFQEILAYSVRWTAFNTGVVQIQFVVSFVVVKPNSSPE